VRLEPQADRRKIVEVNELQAGQRGCIGIIKGLRLTAQGISCGPESEDGLKRGYSITTLKQTGMVLKNASQVQMGDTLVTELAENLIESKVMKVKKKKITK
jgi:hypothetical protein